jgi:hypothetical protein
MRTWANCGASFVIGSRATLKTFDFDTFGVEIQAFPGLPVLSMSVGARGDGVPNGADRIDGPTLLADHASEVLLCHA